MAQELAARDQATEQRLAQLRVEHEDALKTQWAEWQATAAAERTCELATVNVKQELARLQWVEEQDALLADINSKHQAALQALQQRLRTDGESAGARAAAERLAHDALIAQLHADRDTWQTAHEASRKEAEIWRSKFEDQERALQRLQLKVEQATSSLLFSTFFRIRIYRDSGVGFPISKRAHWFCRSFSS
jgi:hypothetical protein